MIHTSCELDLSNFPLDGQKCIVELSNWAYTAKQIMLQESSSKVDLGRYKGSGLWNISESSVWKKLDLFEGKLYQSIIYEFQLQRKSKYFLFNLFVPCLLLSIVALMMFYVPPESGEKISLGVTVLLSFSVFQFVILERMPETSDYIPVAGK